MKIKTLIATTENTSKSYHLTKEALKQLAGTKGHQPVSLNFDSRQIIGKVLDKTVTAQGLVATVDVNDKVLDLILDNKVYLVPSISVVCGNHSIVETAFTLTPMDGSLLATY